VDNQRFDRLARLVAAPRTRRQTIAALGAALSAALFGAGREQSVRAGGVCSVTCPADIEVASDAGQCGATVNYPPTVDTGCGPLTSECDVASGSFFDVGQTVVTCGIAEFQVSCSFTVTVDISELAITCPADMLVVSADPIAVTFPDPTLTGFCGNPGTDCDFASGDVFPLGTTLVTCNGFDNFKRSVQCSFNVTVAAATETPVPTDTPTEAPTEPNAPTVTEAPATEAPATVVPPAPTTAPVVELPNTGSGGGNSRDSILPVAIVGAGAALLARLGLRRLPNRE